MKKPAADVHGGFVLQLQWLRGSGQDDVTSSTAEDGTNLYIGWGDTTNVDASGDTVWKVCANGYCPQAGRGFRIGTSSCWLDQCTNDDIL